MAMAHYEGVAGVARKVTKRYEGVGGVARNVTKAYTGVGGVARQYFSGGVQWRKWSCDYSPASDIWYEEGKNSAHSVGDTATANWGGTTWTMCSDYGFSEDEGFYKIGVVTLPITDIVGYYAVDTTYVRLITDVTPNDSDSYAIAWRVVAVCQGYYYPASYDKGSTDYGSVYAPEGDLPEDGSLVEGSATDSYCVLKVDGTYYYYEKVEE